MVVPLFIPVDPPPFHSTNMSSTVHGSRQFLLGGYKGQDEESTIAGSCVSLASGAFGDIEQSGDTPSNRIGAAVAAVGDSMFLYGGEGLDMETMGDLYEGQIKGNTIEWVRREIEDAIEEAVAKPKAVEGGEGEAAAAPTPAAVRKSKPFWPAAGRKFATACAAVCKGGAEKLFVCGGGGSDTALKSHCLLFDPATKKWADAKCTGKSPFPLIKHSLVVVNNCGVVFGGRTPTTGELNGTVSVIDFNTMSWSSPKVGGGVAPEARFSHSAAVMSNPFPVMLPNFSAASVKSTASSAADGGEGGEEGAPPAVSKKQASGPKGIWGEGEGETEKCIVIFGGVNEEGDCCNDTFVLDRAGNFQVLTTETVPEARFGGNIMTMEAGTECVIFGGCDSGLRLGTSFKLDLFNPDPPPDPVDLSTPREPGYEEVEMDGGTYKGIVREGVREGKGTMVWGGGEKVYEGDWVDDKMEGAGIYTDKEGVYEGQFVGGVKVGDGVWEKADGAEGGDFDVKHYSGSWEGGVCEGDGRTTFMDGFVYEGSFSKGQCHGRGVLLYPDGGECRGVFRSGNMVSGVEVVNGVKYTGPFKVGARRVKEGKGVIVYVDGSTYEGGFRSGRRNGFGLLTDGVTGTVFNGKWVGDMKNGKGEEVAATGSKHVGQWVEGVKEGKGVWTSADGLERKEGVWKGGEWTGGEGGEVEEKKE
ncbi:hypothetical protein TrRE_jg10691 [Triparma retinervis]|uniref:Uncharacterized protein n=1 Tax=Triparma retinervis TaxID=2557542 RepID=A0A9W7E2S9_9STRA|nr:hypothetical protein TrRE_jg10691 [Triparma retinervis]